MSLAAHCFWDDHADYNEKVIINIDGRYKIAVGKYTRDIKVKDNEFTQLIDVCNYF